MKVKASQKAFTVCICECNKNMERFSDTVKLTVSSLNVVLLQLQDLINKSLAIFRVYQEKIQGMVRGAILRLYASFDLRVEGNIGIFMAIDPFAEGDKVGAKGEYTQMCVFYGPLGSCHPKE